MTCIIGFNDPISKRIYMIGDSAGVAGLNITIRSDPKVFINGKFIIGFTSSFRMGQILQHMKFPKQPKKMGDFEFMCTLVADTMREEFKDKGYGKIRESEEFGGFFLMGYKDRLYDIGSDFQIGNPTDQFTATGCGVDFALGALDALCVRGSKPTKILEKAMDIVVYRSGGVRPPYTSKSISYKGKEKSWT